MRVVIKIRTLDQRLHEFKVNDQISVWKFKKLIAPKVNIRPSKQRFLLKGKEVLNSVCLAGINLNDCIIHLVDKYPPFVNPNAIRTPLPSVEQFRESYGISSESSGDDDQIYEYRVSEGDGRRYNHYVNISSSFDGGNTILNLFFFCIL